jgi:hypothetical protein
MTLLCTCHDELLIRHDDSPPEYDAINVHLCVQRAAVSELTAR